MSLKDLTVEQMKKQVKLTPSELKRMMKDKAGLKTKLKLLEELYQASPTDDILLAKNMLTRALKARKII